MGTSRSEAVSALAFGGLPVFRLQAAEQPVERLLIRVVLLLLGIKLKPDRLPANSLVLINPNDGIRNSSDENPVPDSSKRIVKQSHGYIVRSRPIIN